MKKGLKLILVTVVVMVMVSSVPVFGANDITVYKDGQQITFDAPIYIKDGLTMVPMRSIAEAVGCTVTWNDEIRTAFIIGRRTDNNDVVNIDMSFSVGSSGSHYREELGMQNWQMQYKEEDKPIGTAVEIANGRVMLPLRFLAENLGFTVNWDNASRRIDISKGNTSDTQQLRYIDGHSVTEEEYQRAINEQYVELLDEPADSAPGAFQ